MSPSARKTAPMTIGRLARRVGLSRSTLLYYDRLGLVRASGRSPAGYRVFSDDDRRRLEVVCTYREAGVPLADIAEILDGRSGRIAAVLHQRLDDLNRDIARLREQQRLVVRLLRDRGKLRRTRAMDKRGWIELLRATGLTEPDMRRWHAEFERMAPEAHRDFLESLGIPATEVAQIRRASRGLGRS